MARPLKLSYALKIIFLFSSFLTPTLSRDHEKTTYIIHVMKNSGEAPFDSTISYHNSFVSKNSLIHSYEHAMSGFSASLTSDEAESLKNHPGVISVRPERIYLLQTTRSPAFLGLTQQTGAWGKTHLGQGITIGVLDTGYYPNHPSFNGSKMSKPHHRWKGTCQPKSLCTSKIVGARGIINGNATASVLDIDGHGTHTASTAAGTFVRVDNDVAEGTASGVAPQAFLAIYRVCISKLCRESDVVAGIDIAIDDGVDVLSVPLASYGKGVPYYDDATAVGSFAAASNGILVSFAAGNLGPNASTVVNDMPWSLTVGASTIDRRFPAPVKLGNGVELDGESAYQPTNFSSDNLLELIYVDGPLVGLDVSGKIVLLEVNADNPDYQADDVKFAGGVAMILINPEAAGFTHMSDPGRSIPSTSVSFSAGQKIKDYINNETSPTAMISFQGTQLGDTTAPAVSYFSSRGPSKQVSGVLKPDILGPGQNIIASWSPWSLKFKGTMFRILSGTSISCSHLSGVAALVKSAHLDWSAAAVKSAIMTTADLVNANGIPILDEKLTPANILAMGAGQVNPNKAVDPGLVYDIAMDDYVPFLCGLGYTESQVMMITQVPANCSLTIPQGQLNYPTFSVSPDFKKTFFYRTVTNVGEASACYSASIVQPQGVAVRVRPSKMCFTSPKQKATYQVTFQLSKNTTSWGKNGSVVHGFLIWDSKKHSVRSVIAATFTRQVK
ncbi:Subtilisin-like protease SBT1.2 [Striga hermonthica]|uniref:Subtilisin-like protease SBT1.2 n=1 Tax=Striga hermonthica TaxID=68872 RepID=A0A9N7P0Y7_STRHE|nr:Subtilisin-like protease SBT1.2 [Striga hermonthica]